MTGQRGIIHLLALLIVPLLVAANGVDSAARELVRRIPSGIRSPVSLSLRNLSDLAAADVADVRRLLETELRARGIATAAEGASGDELRVTISQNASGYLLVGEIPRGDTQPILIPWTRAASAARAGGSSMTLERTLVITQTDPILDLAAADSGLILLQPGRIARFTLDGGRWTEQETAAFGSLAMPRDARGRLVLQGGAYLAYLPGAICSGAIAPLEARCREADEAWPIYREPALRATFARERNYFNGRLYGAKPVPPFYSAAAAGDAAARLWIFTRLDGRAYLHDAGLDPIGQIGSWGSDVVSIPANCGSGNLVLAARPGDGSEKDGVRVYQVVERQALESAPGVDLPGPVTALWPADDGSAIAVVREASSGEYAAYRLAITCGH